MRIRTARWAGAAAICLDNRVTSRELEDADHPSGFASVGSVYYPVFVAVFTALVIISNVTATKGGECEQLRAQRPAGLERRADAELRCYKGDLPDIHPTL